MNKANPNEAFHDTMSLDIDHLRTTVSPYIMRAIF